LWFASVRYHGQPALQSPKNRVDEMLGRPQDTFSENRAAGALIGLVPEQSVADFMVKSGTNWGLR